MINSILTYQVLDETYGACTSVAQVEIIVLINDNEDQLVAMNIRVPSDLKGLWAHSIRCCWGI